MANEWFRHFNFYNAEGITASGQYTIQKNTYGVNDYINRICKTNRQNAIYNDTDSISISLESVIEYMKVDRKAPGYIDALCKFADTALNKQTAIICDTIGKELNVFQNKLSFKREKVFLSGLYVVKKRYALNVIDEEGVRFNEPKVKVTGLEIKRSDTPKKCRDALKELLTIILNENEQKVQAFVANFEKEFKKIDPAEIALPTGVNNLLTYSDKVKVYRDGAPMHVKAALFYNKMIKDNGLDNIYQLIDDGAKIKYLKLRMPNPTKSPVIGFLNSPPVEFGIESYIDWEKMFVDTFSKAAERMINAAGWSMNYVENLDDWFE